MKNTLRRVFAPVIAASLVAIGHAQTFAVPETDGIGTAANAMLVIGGLAVVAFATIKLFKRGGARV